MEAQNHGQALYNCTQQLDLMNNRPCFSASHQTHIKQSARVQQRRPVHKRQTSEQHREQPMRVCDCLWVLLLSRGISEGHLSLRAAQDYIHKYIHACQWGSQKCLFLWKGWHSHVIDKLGHVRWYRNRADKVHFICSEAEHVMVRELIKNGFMRTSF